MNAFDLVYEFVDRVVAADNASDALNILSDFSKLVRDEALAGEKSKAVDKLWQPRYTYVNSDTRPYAYLVKWEVSDDETRNWSCECKDYEHRGVGRDNPDYECKHIHRAKLQQLV